MSLIGDIAGYWMDGAVRTLDGFRRGWSPLPSDPPPVTPYRVVYEGGKVSLRRYEAVGLKQPTPLLMVYALIKRPFILDLLPGRSVLENFTRQGFTVYLIDWIPPTLADTWRGFDSYVNGELRNAVRAVLDDSGREELSLVGYCFGALLSLLYTAIHPDNIRNLVTLTIPFDMSVRGLPTDKLLERASEQSTDLISTIWGNCPAWMVHTMFNAMAPVHHMLDKYVALYRGREQKGYAETFEMVERWLTSDVPMAGQIFREMTALARHNLLIKNEFPVGRDKANLRRIECPFLNVVAEYDDVVHPSSSLPLVDYVGSTDKRTITYPSGHIGAAISAGAQYKLWPQIGAWLKEHDG